MKAIIIEDEINVRSGFIKMLNVFCPEVEVVAFAEDVESGISIINEHEFDVLFLDINLPDGSGFDLIYRIKEIDFHIIFVTAYDQYALDAFKVSASDYLMKPVSPDELQKAITKVINDENFSSESLEVLEDRIKEDYKQSEKIILKDKDTIKIVIVKDIIYCEAEGSYTCFHLVSGEKILTSMNLKEYDRILEPYGFIRTHHSYLINIDHVMSINKADSTMDLTNGLKVPLATRKKNQVLEVLEKKFIS